MRNFRTCRLLLLLCLFLCTGNAFAQQYNFRTWSLEDGLPQSDVVDMIQDHKGNLWLATLGGLARFNGKNFTTFTKKDGLGCNTLKTVFQDSKGFIWVGSYENGVSRYDGHRFRHFGQQDGLPEGGVYGISEDRNGAIWFSTRKGIACYRNGKFELFGVEQGLPEQNYWAILADKHNNIWVSTLKNGVYRYNGKTFEHFHKEKDGLSNDIVYSLFQDSKGRVWMGTYGGATSYDGLTFRKHEFDGPLTLNRTWGFAEDKEGSLWLALDGGGIIRMKDDRYERITSSNGLSTNFVASVLVSREGMLWFGTTGGGLQSYSFPQFTHFTTTEGLANKHVKALAQDRKGRIWVGTFDGGAGYYDGTRFTWFNTSNGLPNNLVNNIVIDKSNNVWLSTNNGLCRYDGRNFRTFTHDKDNLVYDLVNQCKADDDGTLWIATNEGLSVFDGKTFQNYTVESPRAANRITFIHKSRSGRRYFGTKDGLYYFANGSLKPVKELQEVDFKRIEAIAEDETGALWIASYNNGLIRFNPAARKKSERVVLLTQKQNLLSEGITGLHVDQKQQLWIATIKGLNRLDLNEFYKTGQLNFASYTHQEGFTGIENTFNTILETADNVLWFGTVKGLTRYEPASEKTYNCNPYLELTCVQLFLEKVNWAEQGFKVDSATHLPLRLSLPYTKNHLTFDYQTICLTNPDRIHYRFRLAGFDKEWSKPTTETNVTYSNLSPGTYTFYVQAGNHNGNWNTPPVSYTFSIVPPFWSSEWFMGLCLVLLAGSAISLIWWRERNMKIITRKLEWNVADRTRLLEAKNREKEILLREIHHRVKNNLQIITSMLNLQARHFTDPAAVEVIREVKDRVKSMSMLHQRLYRRDDLAHIDLADYIQGLCRSVFASYGVTENQVRLQCDLIPLKLDIDTGITLGLIVNELVSNTLKYAFPNGRKGMMLIDLLQITEQEYTLTISDDGTGLPEDFEQKMTNSFGLQLVSSLVRKLNGNVKFYSENGTQIRLFFIILPETIITKKNIL